MSVSLIETFRGKEIFLTGVSGFLGKVWMGLLLTEVPGIKRIHLLMRAGDFDSAIDRFEDIVNTSPLFGPLHERHGAGFGAWLSERVRVHQGDLRLDHFGLPPHELTRLRENVDLIVHCAGLVSFDPDMRDALATNILGAGEMARFAASCDHARLMHISTCFVAGNRQGLIPETLAEGVNPNGDAFTAQGEIEALERLIHATEQELDSPEWQTRLDDEVTRFMKKRYMDLDNEGLRVHLRAKQRRRRLRQRMVDVGMEAAPRHGYPNTYTWSKGVAEQLVVEIARDEGVPFTILRPAIVESSVQYPFPGWNEGYNTSGPIVYVLGGWFRQLPAGRRTPFDVIPVDMVCRAMTTACAALLRGTHAPVYHCGSSFTNRFTLGRAVELTALGDRRRLRQKHRSNLDRYVLSRWDATTAHADHWLNTGNVARFLKGAAKTLKKPPVKLPKAVSEPADRLGVMADLGGKKLEKLHHMMELFRPFIHDNHQIFEARGLAAIETTEPGWSFDPTTIQWRRYWIDIHMPGMRRWCYPRLRGKEAPKLELKNPIKLLPPPTEELEETLPVVRNPGPMAVVGSV